MGAVKELWFAEMERLQSEFIDRGIHPDRAYELACQAAFSSSRERLADMADNARKKAAEGPAVAAANNPVTP